MAVTKKKQLECWVLSKTECCEPSRYRVDGQIAALAKAYICKLDCAKGNKIADVWQAVHTLVQSAIYALLHNWTGLDTKA